jgi:transketolase
MRVGNGAIRENQRSKVLMSLIHFHSDSLVRDITVKAQESRIQVLKMVYRAQIKHLGGAFSVAEILASLYFHHMRVKPEQPDWPKRDRLLFSKGHACAMLYASMAVRGYFPISKLSTFRCLGSRLQGHPDRIKLPGIEIPAGPLGHGVAVGVGMALALRDTGKKTSALRAPSAQASLARVITVLGDGEINAGVIWEGALTAAKYRLGNLTAILDCNGIQQTGATAEVLPTEPIVEKWHSFGWYVQEINGHNVREILDALDRADEVHARPSIIIARTTKGKGVSFVEYDHRWHGMPPNEEQYCAAMQELQKGLTNVAGN